MESNLLPEVYFLKYAFPCSHIVLHIRKEISLGEYNRMKRASIENIPLSRGYLEKIFFRAFERIEKIAKEMNKDKWDKEVIKTYFRARHNSIVDSSDNPDNFKEQCRVYEAEVKEVNKKDIVVSYKSISNKIKNRKVFKDYVQDVQAGDKVTIHYSYAVEIIS